MAQRRRKYNKINYGDGGKLDTINVPGTKYIPVGKYPSVKNKDGTYSNEITIGISDERGSFLIPTMWDGVKHSKQEAIDRFYLTGEHMGSFSNDEKALEGARLREEMNNKLDKKGYDWNKSSTPGSSQYGVGGSIGSLLGTVAGIALAPVTGGLSIPAAAAIGGALGGGAGNLVDEIVGKGKGAKNNNIISQFSPPTVNLNPYGNMAKGGKLEEIRSKHGGSNVGKKTFADGSRRRGPYVGKSGGAPAGSYPIPDLKHARAALALAHNAPNPGGIKKAVYKKYPQLKHDIGGIVSETNYGSGGKIRKVATKNGIVFLDDAKQEAYDYNGANLDYFAYSNLPASLPIAKEMAHSWMLGDNALPGDSSAIIHGYYGDKNVDTTTEAYQQGKYQRNAQNQEAIDNLLTYKSGGWIKKAINPAHKGYCTPITKSTCTPRRKALALRFKHGDLHREMGGLTAPDEQYCMGGMMKGRYDMGGASSTNKIDIEKGEFRVGLDRNGQSQIKEKYINPNVFSPHAKNPMKEPVGNFVDAPAGDIIISKDMTSKYSQLDDIGRKSIERKLVQRQLKEKPEQLGMQRSKKGGVVIRSYDNGGGLFDFNTLQNGILGVNQGIPPISPDSLDPNAFQEFPYPDYSGSSTSYSPYVSTEKVINPNDTYADFNSFQNSVIGRTGVEIPTPSEPSFVDNLLSNAGRIAPIAADIFQITGALKKDPVNRLRNAAYPQARNTLSQLETNVNVEPQLQQVSRSGLAQRRNISNLNQGAPVQQANETQVAANQLAAETGIMGQKLAQEQANRNAKREALANLDFTAGAQDVGYQAEADLQNAQTDAARRGIINASVADIGSKFSTFSSEDKYRQIIGAALPSYYQFDAKNPWSGDELFKVNPSEAERIAKFVIPKQLWSKYFSPDVMAKFNND